MIPKSDTHILTARKILTRRCDSPNKNQGVPEWVKIMGVPEWWPGNRGKIGTPTF